MRISARLLVVFILAIPLSSCFEDPDCIDFRNDILGISFKHMADGKADTLSIVGITMSNTDSIFSKSIDATAVYLPLNVNQSQQEIIFDLSTGTSSMVVDYKSQPQFESVECGPRFILSGINVSIHNFDSVVVVGSIPLTTKTGVNIVIFSRP